jgi:hypothetical protein
MDEDIKKTNREPIVEKYHRYYAKGYKYSAEEKANIKVSVKVEIKEILSNGVVALTLRNDIPNGRNKEVFLPFKTVKFFKR